MKEATKVILHYLNGKVNFLLSLRDIPHARSEDWVDGYTTALELIKKNLDKETIERITGETL